MKELELEEGYSVLQIPMVGRLRIGQGFDPHY